MEHMEDILVNLISDAIAFAAGALLSRYYLLKKTYIVTSKVTV